MSKKQILFCASEVYPFAKSGGLGDVAHSLPRALQGEYALSVVLPLYKSIEREKFGISALEKEFTLFINEKKFTIQLYSCVYEEMEYLFVYEALLCEREFMYGPPDEGYSDNALRFALFNHAIVALLKEKHYDLVHLNDWQSALVPMLLLEEKDIDTKTLFTIHNLAYQGIFAFEELEHIGIDKRHFHMDALEFHGSINFLKAGIAFADGVTTVSEVYAQEILTPAFGCGLDGFLRYHQSKLCGILNGLDTEHFHPAHDKLIPFIYTTRTQKAQNKKTYLKEHKLKGAQKPLFVFIGRFTQQKGIKLLSSILESLALLDCNVLILGDGEESLQTPLLEVAKKYTNIRLFFEYNEVHSHTIYASADFLLMPSLFEPCGLNQMIAMSYGAIPIVHGVGGLKESVSSYKDFDTKSSQGYGIVFHNPNADAFFEAILEAFALYERKKDYNSLVKHNMQCDFSWSKSAQSYSKLYKKLQGE